MHATLVNGETDRQIDVADRGLNYGDGVFETIQIRQGVAMLWARHIERMRAGAERLKIPFDDTTAALFLDDVRSLTALCTTRAVVKIILTRGNAERGYKIVKKPVTRIATLSAFPDLHDQQRAGISALVCNTQLARQPLLAGIKHLNRLEQVLARSEWDDVNITEGIVCDTQGYVVEGCMSNLFWIKGDTLFTPDLTHSGVCGVIRDLLLELSSRETDLKISIGFYKIDQLLDADEVFVTNSVFDVLSVKQIYLQPSHIADHSQRLNIKLGPKALHLSALLQQYYLQEVSH